MAFGPDTLVSSVGRRAAGMKTLYEPDGSVQYAGPRGSRSVQARMFVADANRFRLDATHVLAGKVGSVILDEGRFFLLNLRQKKAFEGETMAFLAERFPKLGLSEEDLDPRRLFFPTLEPASGETIVMSFQPGAYDLYYFDRGRAHPNRMTRLDAWSHSPVRAVFYHEDGAEMAIVNWSRFVYLRDLDFVLAKDVEIRIPEGGHAIRLHLAAPKLNAEITGATFRFRAPAGIAVEEVLPEGDTKGHVEGGQE